MLKNLLMMKLTKKYVKTLCQNKETNPWGDENIRRRYRIIIANSEFS